jgi:hypothetical protein
MKPNPKPIEQKIEDHFLDMKIQEGLDEHINYLKKFIFYYIHYEKS